MKRFPFLMLFLALTILSCSTDENFIDAQTNATINIANNDLERTVAFVAENKNNPFDYTGKTYNAILQEYDNNNFPSSNPQVIVENVESIANNLPDFIALKNSNAFVNANYETLINIISGDYLIDYALANSGLSLNAQVVLNNFIVNLKIQVESQSTATVHTFILDFEDTIWQQNNLSTSDKKIILSTTSIIRYANAENKNGGPDKHWRDIKNSITATLSCIAQNSAEGVLNAAVIGALQNNNN